MNVSIQSQYYAGVLLIVVSATTFSTAGLFTKAVEAGAWDVIFWRGLFASAVTAGWTWRAGSVRRNLYGLGFSGWAVGVIGALGTAAFIPAFKLTSIANVSVIYAVAPLIAILLAWVALGERASLRTVIGCLAAFSGVAIIVSGSVGHVNLTGDLLALWMTVAMASVMVIFRKYPDTPVGGAAILQSVLLLPFAALLGDPLGVDPTEILVLAAFGVLFALASVTLAEGAKRVPSGQTALLSALETPLAPVLAFLVLTEVPNAATLVGGSLVFLAILASIRTGR